MTRDGPRLGSVQDEQRSAVGSGDSASGYQLSRVWRRMRKSWLTRFGVGAILGLVVVATYAPLITLNQPLYWDSGAGPEFPWFRALFNRLLFENTVDVFFNALAILGPVYVAGVMVVSRWRKERFNRWRVKMIGAFAALHAVIVLLMTPSQIFGVGNPLHYTERVVDFRSVTEQMDAAGRPYRAVFPLRRYGYRDTDPEQSVEPPSGRHWLGTDSEGRDVFARMLYGTRISLSIGVVAVAIYVAIGVVLGALAGYFGGHVDLWISRLIEVMICFPSFFLILTIAALIEQRSIFHVMAVIGITSWTGVARLVRAEFLKQRNLEYVLAAVALGLGRHRIIFRHILPNALAPVLVTATFGVATAILIESSLAFLGIGDLSVASWGETLNAGRVQGKLWLVLAPGAAIFFVVSVFNLVGEALRDALDPRLR